MTEWASTPAIEVDNLSIRYGSVQAVETVSFAVREGQQLTLLGPSGCGKTSTLRAVAGLETPTSGVIRAGGKPIYDSTLGINVPTEQRGMSMVFQSYAIWPHMTVFDNVAYGLRVALAVPNRPSTFVEDVHAHPSPEFAAPPATRAGRIAQCKAGDDVGSPADAGEVDIALDPAVDVIVAVRGQRAAGRENGPKRAKDRACVPARDPPSRRAPDIWRWCRTQ